MMTGAEKIERLERLTRALRSAYEPIAEDPPKYTGITDLMRLLASVDRKTPGP